MKNVQLFIIMWAFSMLTGEIFAKDSNEETPLLDTYSLKVKLEDIKSVKVYNYTIGGKLFHHLADIEFYNLKPIDLLGKVDHWFGRFFMYHDDNLLFDPALRFSSAYYSSIIVFELTLGVDPYRHEDIFQLIFRFPDYSKGSYETPEEKEKREYDEDLRNLRNEQYKVFLQYLKDTDKLIDASTGIEPVNPQEPNAISLYPNPTTGELRITNYETTLGVSQLGIEKVEIYDITGKKLSTVNYQLSTNHLIDISHLPEGIYFLRLTTEKGLVTKKVVKIK